MLKQIDIVRGVIGDQVAVQGVLCFVEADWPLLGGSFTTRGVEVMWPKKLYPLLKAGDRADMMLSRMCTDGWRQPFRRHDHEWVRGWGSASCGDSKLSAVQPRITAMSSIASQLFAETAHPPSGSRLSASQ